MEISNFSVSSQMLLPFTSNQVHFSKDVDVCVVLAIYLELS
jgi:hypothetical protein